MAKKKNKTKISKRRQKAKHQKMKKRKLRLIKGGGGGEASESAVIERPGMPYLGAPEGFRSISFSQAILEYGAPLVEQIKNDDAMDSAFQLAGMFWNYALSVRDGEVDRKLEKEIVKGVKSNFRAPDLA